MPGPEWAPRGGPTGRGGFSGCGSSLGIVGSSSRKASVSAGGQGHCPTVRHDRAWLAGLGGWCQSSLAVSEKWAICVVPSPTLAMWTPREMALVRSAGAAWQQCKAGFEPGLAFPELWTNPAASHLGAVLACQISPCRCCLCQPHCGVLGCPDGVGAFLSSTQGDRWGQGQ